MSPAEELRSSDISTIKVGDLTATHDVVTVTRHGGFLSAASRRLLEIIKADYRAAMVFLKTQMKARSLFVLSIFFVFAFLLKHEFWKDVR